MPESAIARRYPGARQLAEAGGQTLWRLRGRTLTATTSALGVVTAISLGATVESGDDATTSSFVVVWARSRSAQPLIAPPSPAPRRNERWKIRNRRSAPGWR